MEPPDLVCMPMPVLTGAMLLLDVLPALAPSSIISLALMVSSQPVPIHLFPYLELRRGRH
jgi:hypothetical protein